MFDTRRVKCYHMNMIFPTRRPSHPCLMVFLQTCDDGHCLRLVNCINVLSVTFGKKERKTTATTWTIFRVIYASFIHSMTNPLFQWGLMKKGIAFASWTIRDVCLSVRKNIWKLREYCQEARVRISAANVVELIKVTDFVQRKNHIW